MLNGTRQNNSEDTHAPLPYKRGLKWKALQQGPQVVPATVAPPGVHDTSGFAVFASSATYSNGPLNKTTSPSCKRQGNRKCLSQAPTVPSHPTEVPSGVLPTTFLPTPPIAFEGENESSYDTPSTAGPETPRDDPEPDCFAAPDAGPSVSSFPLGIRSAPLNSQAQLVDSGLAPADSSYCSTAESDPEYIRTLKEFVNPQYLDL